MTPRPALDSSGLPAGYPFKPDYEITPREVRERLARKDLFLIDCRTHDEWAVAKIDGALLVPLHEFESRLQEIEDAAGDADIAVHCHLGGRSMKAALFLRQRGLETARSMAGGIDLWSLDIDASVPRYGRTPAGTYQPLPPP